MIVPRNRQARAAVAQAKGFVDKYSAAMYSGNYLRGSGLSADGKDFIDLGRPIRKGTPDRTGSDAGFISVLIMPCPFGCGFFMIVTHGLHAPPHEGNHSLNYDP